MSGFFGKEKAVGKVVLVDIQEIVPNPSQPRIYFAEDDLEELAWSIRQNGLLQPLTVRKNKFGQYELISGERRLRAGKMAGLEQIPCIIVETDERQSAIFALIENIQRADLNFFEEAQAIKNLISEWGVTQEEPPKSWGKRSPTVRQQAALVRLEEPEQRDYSEKRPDGTARARTVEDRRRRAADAGAGANRREKNECHPDRGIYPAAAGTAQGASKAYRADQRCPPVFKYHQQGARYHETGRDSCRSAEKTGRPLYRICGAYPDPACQRAGSGDQIRMGEYLSHGAPFRSR